MRLNMENEGKWAWFLVVYTVVLVVGYFTVGCAKPPPYDPDAPINYEVPKPPDGLDYFFDAISTVSKAVSIIKFF